tara:strand:- start:196 stop:609 length:414 start_codon:yes stop_codon:yes gene_type:complete
MKAGGNKFQDIVDLTESIEEMEEILNLLEKKREQIITEIRETLNIFIDVKPKRKQNERITFKDICDGVLVEGDLVLVKGDPGKFVRGAYDIQINDQEFTEASVVEIDEDDYGQPLFINVDSVDDWVNLDEITVIKKT